MTTNEAISYRLTLPPGIKLSSSGESNPSVPLLKKLPISSTTTVAQPLQGRTASLSGILKNIDLNAVQSFAQMPLLEVAEPEDLPFFTGGATCTEDTVADVSYLIRTLMPEAVSTEAIGVTTGENVFQGMWAAIKAGFRFKRAYEIGDKGGMVEGGTDAIRGASQSVGGAAYLGYRATMIPADIHHIDTSIAATTPLGKAAFALGMIGNVFFMIFYAMISIWSAYGLVKDFQFSSAMKANDKGDTALFNFLVGKIKADPKEKLSKLMEAWNKHPEKKEKNIASYKKALEAAALDKLTDQFLLVQEQSEKAGQLNGKKPLSKSEVKEVLRQLFAAKNSELCQSGAYKNYMSSLGLEEKDLNGLDFTMLQLIGFKLGEEKREAKKEAKIARVTDGTCVDAIQKAARMGLAERLTSNDNIVKEAATKEVAALKDRVTTENTKNKWIHTALLTIGIIGLVVSVLGFLVLPPAGVIALTVLTLALCVAMLATDAYFMKSGLDSGAPGKYDKIYLAVIATVIVAAIAVSIGVTLTFGMPLLPLIFACVIAAIGLFLIGYSYYKSVQKEKKWIADHPDLQTFQTKSFGQQTTTDQPLDDRVAGLFKKLPKADRRMIKEKYFAMSSRGEIQFQSEKYKALDTHFDFGAGFLFDQINSTKPLDEKEHQLLVRGMKKTVKLFWAKYENAKTEQNKIAALQLQAVFDRVLKKDFNGVYVKLTPVMSNQEVYAELKKNIWYVAKRQESSADLNKVVAAVISDKTSLPKVQINPLAQHVVEVYSKNAA